MMAIKKRKKGGKSDIKYYGKATDGYDPSKHDGDTWGDGGGSDGDGGGSGMGTVGKTSLGHYARSGSSKAKVTKDAKHAAHKPKPKPKGSDTKPGGPPPKGGPPPPRRKP
jgi:hypothetical protein